MTHSLKTFLLVTSALVLSQTSFAAPVTWNLGNVSFSDGATATGTMTWDADSQTLSNWNISVTNGTLSAFTYNPTDSTEFASVQVSGYQDTYMFDVDGSTRELRITPVAALTDAGGTVNINLNTWGGGSGSVECDNCSPYRPIVSGDLTTMVSSTPEPASMGLLGLAFACAGVYSTRRRNTSKR